MRDGFRAVLAALLIAVLYVPEAATASVSVELVRAYHKPDRPYLLRFAEENRESPLYPIVLARAVDVSATAPSPPKMVSDLLRQQGIPAVEKLRGAFLKEWARIGNWQEFERHDMLVPEWYADRDIELACARLAYVRSTGHPVQRQWLDTILTQDARFPELCVPALRGAVREGIVPADLAMRKALAVAAFEGRKAADAVAQSLGGDLDRLPRFAGMVGKALNILSLARSNFGAARSTLQGLAGVLDPELHRLVLVHLGGIAVRQHRSDGHALIKSANGYSVSLHRVAGEWRCRAAIREAAWGDLVAAIDAMPAVDRDSSAWTYWRAVGLLGSNRKSEGQAIMARLAEARDYYGLLAGGGRPMPVRTDGAKRAEAAAWVAKMSATPEYRRTLALYAAGLWIEGALEMNVLLRGAGPAEYLAAAELARRNGIPDRQIAYADRTAQTSELALAYPLLHRREVASAASQEGVPVATIYAIIRQESRFVPYAVSSAGAIGLMQLMPDTAKRLMKPPGERRRLDEASLFHASTNILLGTAYLAQLGRRYSGNLAQMAAAYNAGPSRTDTWVRQLPGLSNAAFVELIPYDETRDYVKAVLSNEAVYRVIAAEPAGRQGVQTRTAKRKAGRGKAR